MLLSFRKDLKFVTEIEDEIKNLVELANKVRWYIQFGLTGVAPVVWCAIWWPFLKTVFERR